MSKLDRKTDFNLVTFVAGEAAFVGQLVRGASPGLVPVQGVVQTNPIHVERIRRPAHHREDGLQTTQEQISGTQTRQGHQGHRYARRSGKKTMHSVSLISTN